MEILVPLFWLSVSLRKEWSPLHIVSSVVGRVPDSA